MNLLQLLHLTQLQNMRLMRTCSTKVGIKQGYGRGVEEGGVDEAAGGDGQKRGKGKKDFRVGEAEGVGEGGDEGGTGPNKPAKAQATCPHIRGRIWQRCNQAKLAMLWKMGGGGDAAEDEGGGEGVGVDAGQRTWIAHQTIKHCLCWIVLSISLYTLGLVRVGCLFRSLLQHVGGGAVGDAEEGGDVENGVHVGHMLQATWMQTCTMLHTTTERLQTLVWTKQCTISKTVF
jgi:hypothetical protein